VSIGQQLLTDWLLIHAGLKCGFRTMPIGVPGWCRSLFRFDPDQHSVVMAITYR
jgi:hypothetical protein